MTTRPASPRTRPPAAAQSAALVVRAERIKLASLRSTWALLASSAVTTLLGGGLTALTAAMAAQAGDGPPAGFDAVAASVSGVGTAAFLVGVVGVLQVTGELTTGLGRTTFAAVPRRGRVVAAKAVALTLLAAPVAAVATALTVVVAQSLLGGLGVPPISPRTVQAVLGAAGFAVAVGILGQALAWLVRSTVGAAFALLGLLSLLPSLLRLLPEGVADAVVPVLPGEAARALMGTDPAGASLPELVALPVTLLWCAVGLLLAARALHRRDA